MSDNTQQLTTLMPKGNLKGVVITLSAIALSIKPGGSIRELEVAGGLRTHGKGVDALEMHGHIETLRICGSLAATGGGFDEI